MIFAGAGGRPRGHRWRGANVLARALLCLLPLAAAALTSDRTLRGYGRQNWQSGSGLPQNTVHAVLQTRDGFLWIGTEAGLVRFDGIDFQTFDRESTPELPGDSISALVEDAPGSLWIGTTAGLVRYQAGRFQAFGSAQGLPSEACLGLSVTRRGELLALTPGGAARLNGERFALLPGSERLGLAEGASVVADEPDGGVTIAGASAWLSYDSSMQPVAPARSSSVGEIHAVAAAPDGTVWIGGAGGLAAVRPSRLSPPTPRVAGLPSRGVTALLAGADGSLWVGTERGLAALRHGVLRAYPELSGVRIDRLFLDRAGAVWAAGASALARISLAGEADVAPRLIPGNVLAVFEDREGSMWFGTETGGLHLLRDRTFSTFSVEDGLSAPLVRAVFEDHAGILWVGESEGGLDRIQGGSVSHFAERLPSRTVLALAETREAGDNYALWAGTPAGLVRIGPGRSTRVFTTADGLADDFVRSLYADRDGSLWIGTRNGLTHFDGKDFRSYSKLDGLAGDLVGAMLRTREGTLWVGTLGGLSRMDGQAFTTLPVAGQGPPGSSHAVTSLLEDTQGRLWVGLQGLGLGRVEGGAVVPVGAGKNHLPTTIYGMLQDGAGNLWLSSRTGVDRVRLAGLTQDREGTPAAKHYDTADGMRIREASGGGHPAAWRGRDGALWFATLDGVAVVHPAKATGPAVPPLAAIESVEIDTESRPVVNDGRGDDRPLQVAPGHGRLSIHYAGLSFLAPQRVRYRYRLAGLDKDWVEAGNRRTAFYTNVPPGRYRFEVLAEADGVWSPAPAQVRFTVEPFFYQTGWFYTLAVLVLVWIGYLTYRRRVHTVAARYQAVEEERGRIAREIHDTLAQGFVAVAVQLELAERLLGSSAAAAAAQLRQTKEMVRESLEEARRSIWNLRSTADAQALPARLSAHVVAVARRMGPGRPALRFAVHGAYRALARSVEEEILRIAQEAIANAVTHAGASLIEATLNYDPELVELRVCDDGKGLAPGSEEASARGHFGLQGMRERAARIGAALAVESRRPAAEGTIVTLQLELRREIAGASAREKGR